MQKITIITVAYNSIGTIQDTIESVLQQDYSNIEYIIVDGASTDGTIDLAKNYEDAFKLKGFDYNVYSEPDDGLYDAMNKGIEKSIGDVIGILNSDDFYTSSDVISKVMTHMYDSSCETLIANLEFISGEDKHKVVRRWEVKKGDFSYGWMPPHPSTFIKKEIYDLYGVYNTSFEIAADYDLLFRFIKLKGVKCCFLNKSIIKMRTGGTSTNGFLSYFKGNREVYQILKLYKQRFRMVTVTMKIIRKIPQLLKNT